MIWAIFFVMTALAAAAIVWPILRPRGGAAPRAAYDAEVYRDQLAEIERDRARGLVDEAEAKAARIEIARRLLAADDRLRRPDAWAVGDGRLSVGGLVAAALPVGALFLYMGLGSPGLPGQPTGSRPLSAQTAPDRSDDPQAQPAIEAMVGGLAQRLAQNPNDAQGWALLGRSYMVIGKHAEAAEAWRRGAEVANGDPEFLGAYAESLILGNDGLVVPAARQALSQILTVLPGDPRARFYLAEARFQAGEAREAVQAWVDLAAAAPSDAPWLPSVRTRIEEAAKQAKIDLRTVAPTPGLQPLPPPPVVAGPRPPTQAPAQPQAARGPSAADMAAAGQMSAEDRQSMIRGMVEGLAARLQAQPDDPDGWRRLARAYGVLGESDKGLAALKRLSEIAPNDIAAQNDYAEALFVAAGRPASGLPAEFVAVMRRVLALDPDDVDALWFVGLAEVEAGNKQQATQHWTQLARRLPADAPGRSELDDRLKKLTAQ